MLLIAATIAASITLHNAPFHAVIADPESCIARRDIHRLTGTINVSSSGTGGGASALSVHDDNGTLPDYTLHIAAGKGVERKITAALNCKNVTALLAEVLELLERSRSSSSCKRATLWRSSSKGPTSPHRLLLRRFRRRRQRAAPRARPTRARATPCRRGAAPAQPAPGASPRTSCTASASTTAKSQPGGTAIGSVPPQKERCTVFTSTGHFARAMGPIQ